MTAKDFFEQTKGGLIVSCYAAEEYNVEFSNPTCISCLTKAVIAGGASAIRTNLENIKTIKQVTSLPVIGIKKIDCFQNEMRITPTLKQVSSLVEAGANAIAVDGTKRQRLDDYTLSEFISEIKSSFDVIVLADISTLEEAIVAEKSGVDGVDTTLAGYTSYSRNPSKLGKFPIASPDFTLITEISENCDLPIIAEGRFWEPSQAKKAIKFGAHAVVVGTAITNPHKVVERFVRTMKN